MRIFAGVMFAAWLVLISLRWLAGDKDWAEHSTELVAWMAVWKAFEPRGEQ